MLSLNTPTAAAPKISKRILPALRRLGIATIRDLLFHFPSRYEEFPDEQAVADIAMGERVTITGAIQTIGERRTARGLRMTEARVADASGAINIVWFNQPFLANTLKEGAILRLSGKVARGARGLSLQNPSYEKITHGAPNTASAPHGIHTGGMVAIYPETEGITSRWLRFLIKTYLPLAATLADPLSPETRTRHDLIEINTALRQIHFPESQKQATDAERRFIFEELLLIQLRALRERSRMKQRAAYAIPFDIELIKSFVASLPFKLTDAQRRAIWEIGHDLAKPQPMNRLLEGDVGSGKTVVAAAAAMLAIRAGRRVAYMAPTEILAVQHHATFAHILASFHVNIGLRTASSKKSKRAGADGDAPDILIGTHALIQKNAAPENLGLVIIDEQHRFGVHQRMTLVRGITQTSTKDEFLRQSASCPRESPQKMVVPHFLSMTATPIPRTLALTIYGDLDLSLLDEMPKNRKTITTKIVSPEKRAEVYRFIRNAVRAGRQVFVICPRIEKASPKSHIQNRQSQLTQQKLLLAELKTVTEEYKKLSEFIFPDLRIAMLHGRMKPKEKATAMKRFAERDMDILVSTSIIEVGMDVPNATIMMIEGAERFGLAQLHQFRGRVGRGADQSYCFLFPTEDGPVSRRLRAVVDAKNGFDLAEYDLKIRGPGDLFGDRQWGEAGLAIKGITDPVLVRAVRDEAVLLARQSPDLAKYPALAARLAALEKTLHLE